MRRRMLQARQIILADKSACTRGAKVIKRRKNSGENVENCTVLSLSLSLIGGRRNVSVHFRRNVRVRGEGEGRAALDANRGTNGSQATVLRRGCLSPCN